MEPVSLIDKFTSAMQCSTTKGSVRPLKIADDSKVAWDGGTGRDGTHVDSPDHTPALGGRFNQRCPSASTE